MARPKKEIYVFSLIICSFHCCMGICCHTATYIDGYNIDMDYAHIRTERIGLWDDILAHTSHYTDAAVTQRSCLSYLDVSVGIFYGCVPENVKVIVNRSSLIQ